MKSSLVVSATVVLVAVAAVSTAARGVAGPARPSSPRETALLRLPPATPAGQTTVFGHIKSLVRQGGRYEMRFDPALLLHGATAEQAALEDTGSSDVPNDYYVLDESHRLLTYVVARNAKATILTRGPKTTTVSVAELAQLLKGKNPQRRPLFGRPKDFGFWIRVGQMYPNPVLSLDEQYQP